MDSASRSLATRLAELARNLWWTWQPEVIAIFRDLDPALWREVNHNPAAFVDAFPPDQLVRRAEETALDSRINFAFHQLEQYLHADKTWARATCGVLHMRPVAYFSAEFALHESLPIYSGGLGALAGDHLKGASDLGVPLVGVGLFYGRGYFEQRVDADGWQRESYGHVELEQLPVRRALAPDGEPLVVEIPLDGGRLRIGAWRVEVGRASLVLLDADVDGNPSHLRELTSQLYGGDQRLRLRQEMVLGIGGIRMLRALGVRPGVLHLNEGHCALAPLELARQQAAVGGIPFMAAHRDISLRTVFTTHTPVLAGHDYFTSDLVLEHLEWLAGETDLTRDELLGLGRADPADPNGTFCMTILALRSARYANAVSAVHGHVTRQMWKGLWPGHTEAEVPIGHITNGVHAASWLAPQMSTGYEHYLGRDWRTRMSRPDVWESIEQVDDAVLWETHQVLKRHLLNYLMRKTAAAAALDRDVLTLTFARRFAEYKRPTLLLADVERLTQLVNAKGRGLQLVFAGKAHPRDDEGKRLLQRIVTLTRDPRFRGRVVFVENYDFSVARHLVQGSDVWLNTPRRPLEACGTSGQKALLNGVLNLSILDGWWAEAYDRTNGFAIGNGEAHRDPMVQDARDAEALYRTLEEEVVPLYYDRAGADVPTRWVQRMKRAALTLAARFNTDRMVRDYVLRCYLPAAGGVSSAMPR